MSVSSPGPLTGLDGVTVVAPDGSELLHDVTLLAGPTELIGILGPSGSGKSTVLRAIAGLVPLQRGDVVIGGRSMQHVPTHARRLAMVFETPALIPFLDVDDNMTWGMRARHRPDTEIRDRLRTRSAMLRLGRLLGRRPPGLSAGERGLVGLGRALLDVPTAFLFDEPLGHLDASERVRMRHLVADLVHRAGVPAFFVTHDQTDALGVADRVAVLRAGQVVQVGTTHELYDEPADLFVAGFVGSPTMGLLPGRLVAAGGWAGVQVGDRVLPLWTPLAPSVQMLVGQDVVLGLRPDEVLDGTTPRDAETVTLPAVAESVERLGPETVVTVTVDAPPVHAPGADRPERDRAQLRARYPAHAQVRPGDRVTVAVDATRAHIFDPDSGRALWHPASDREHHPEDGLSPRR